MKSLIVCNRAQKSPLAKFLNATLPPDPKPAFVWPRLAVKVVRKHFRTPTLIFASGALLATTIGMIHLLSQIPVLDQSVLGLMVRAFEAFIPAGWATSAAWAIGIVAMISVGGLTNHNRLQHKLQALPATKYEIYNFLLMAALWEEQAFRSGSEKWSWPQRARASFVFGVVHIANIWYSMAAGVALGLTGFGFMLVYQWYYRKTRSQIAATAASAIVHATYNVMALGVIAGVALVNFLT